MSLMISGTGNAGTMTYLIVWEPDMREGMAPFGITEFPEKLYGIITVDGTGSGTEVFTCGNGIREFSMQIGDTTFNLKSGRTNIRLETRDGKVNDLVILASKAKAGGWRMFSVEAASLQGNALSCNIAPVAVKLHTTQHREMLLDGTIEIFNTLPNSD